MAYANGCCLVGMDTALPIGASFPWAKGITPEAYAAEITRYTQPLKDLPGFAGWDWVANWWVADPNLRFATPEEKTKYEAAFKQVEATGVWDPRARRRRRPYYRLADGGTAGI